MDGWITKLCPCSFFKVDKEFKILSVLHPLSFPVPSPLLFCGDVSILGTEFYVMEYVEVRRI